MGILFLRFTFDLFELFYNILLLQVSGQDKERKILVSLSTFLPQLKKNITRTSLTLNLTIS